MMLTVLFNEKNTILLHCQKIYSCHIYFLTVNRACIPYSQKMHSNNKKNYCLVKYLLALNVSTIYCWKKSLNLIIRHPLVLLHELKLVS